VVGNEDGGSGERQVVAEREDGAEEPVFKDGPVTGLMAHVVGDEEGIDNAGEPSDDPEDGGVAEAAPGYGHGGRDQEDSDEVDDGWSSEGFVAVFGLAGLEGDVGDEGRGDELQADEGRGSGAEDDVEVLPGG
jgi:hypothetical protein